MSHFIPYDSFLSFHARYHQAMDRVNSLYRLKFKSIHKNYQYLRSRNSWEQYKTLVKTQYLLDQNCPGLSKDKTVQVFRLTIDEYFDLEGRGGAPRMETLEKFLKSMSNLTYNI